MRDCSFVLISLTLASKWPPPPIGRSLGSRGPEIPSADKVPPAPLLHRRRADDDYPYAGRDLPLLSIYSRGEREEGREGESACIAERRSSPPFVAAATQVPFTASNVIIKFAERCLAKCQDGREEERERGAE